ncbi:MAG: hypothetical protein ACREHD_15900 [Pirellulales bacterium]
MATQNLPELIPDGTFVEILNSGFKRARVAEYRGPFGPRGARIYRVLVRKKPRMYIEVREDQLRVLDRQSAGPAQPSQAPPGDEDP